MYGSKTHLRNTLTEELTIRAATSGDAAALTSLAFRSKAYWGYSLEFMAACKKELTYSGAMIDSPQFHFYVAETGGQLAGFYALDLSDSQTAQLEALFVVPKRIGSGIGRALIDHCKTISRQIGVRDIVIQGDPNAESFYLAAGGKPSGYRESASIRGRQLPVFTIKL